MNAAVKLQKSAVTRHCPKCGSARTHRSHRRRLFDRILAVFGAEIRRCHDCRSRQAWFRALALPLESAEQASHFWTQMAVLLGGFLLCLVFVWWMIQRFGESTG